MSGKQVFENLTPNKVRVIIPRFVSTLYIKTFNRNTTPFFI
ncbi:hypothetical protein MSA_7910 [Streptococcus agalactiae ILRI005]|nr:hypothetical protein MSA_7910 [Streptococcus agalactiae ILRI005]